MRRKIFNSVILFFIVSISRGQNKIYTYYLDENLVSTQKTKAVIIGKGVKEDSLFRLNCYTLTGTRPYMTFHFTDSSLSDLKGPFTSYHRNGNVENRGNYMNAFEEGVWERWDSAGRKVDSTFYVEGNKMQSSSFTYHKNNMVSFYTFKDSVKNTYHDISYDESGKIKFEANFVGSNGIVRVYDKAGSVKVDSVFNRELIEPNFPGGSQGWVKYLRENLNANIPYDNKAPEGTYNVIVKFVIGPNGNITNVVAETNHGFGMEKEALRIIENGPTWIPALRYGQKVDSFRKQPIMFVVQKM